MLQPPRLEDGSIKPHDSPDILNSDKLIRRIHVEHHTVHDENRNCRRISTKAFNPSSGSNGGMSVDNERLIVEANVNPVAFVSSSTHQGSVTFTAGVARSVDLLVGYSPVQNNNFHCEVWGKSRPNRFSGAQVKALINNAQWFVQIPGIEL